MTQSAAFIAFSAATDKADMAVAVTGYSVCQQIGVTMGTSTTMAVLQGQLKNTLTHLLKDVPEADSVRCPLSSVLLRLTESNQIIKRSMSDIGYIQSLTGRLRSDVAIAYIGSFRYTYSKFSLISQLQEALSSDKSVFQYSRPVSQCAQLR